MWHWVAVPTFSQLNMTSVKSLGDDTHQNACRPHKEYHLKPPCCCSLATDLPTGAGQVVAIKGSHNPIFRLRKRILAGLTRRLHGNVNA